ncbi:Helicase protein MOM1, partial [Mucuna pruriens]
MANDSGSGRVADKGPITRSSRESLSKKAVASASTTPNRKSERFEKRTPPSLAVRMDQKKTPSPLRRSERTRNASPSPPSDSKSRSSGSKTQRKKHCTGKQLAFEASHASEDDDEGEERDAEASSKLRIKRMNARVYRAFFDKSKRNCHEKKNGMDRSTQEGDDRGEEKIDGCLKGNCLDSAKDDEDILPPEDAICKEMRAEPKLSGPVKEHLENNVTVDSLVPSNAATCEPSGVPERVQSDSCKEETSQMLGSRDSISNENLIRKCVEHDKGDILLSSKRKRTMVDMHSDASAMLVDNGNVNLIEDGSSSRICSNVVETSGSCSKRIRRISLSDVKRDWRKSTNNDDQPSSKSNGEKLSTRNKEDSERPQGNTVETEKIRKQQRSLHLLLKPEIANLCEILRLPGNVKSMVEKCLEYTMNNYQICTEPVSILQAFQLSLCWTAASLLNHKLDFEASLMLAKQHLNFDCKKEVVDEINSRLWDLKENFLLLTRESNVACSPKASESSNGVYSYTEVTPEAELIKNDNSKNIKNVQKRKNQWNKLLLMQQEERQKLKKDIENEIAEFRRRYNIEWAAIRSCSTNDVVRKEKLRVFNNEYIKRIGELERQHSMCLKDLEAKQLKARLMFQESSAPDELLNLVALNELGTKVAYFPTWDQVQHHNALKASVSDHVAEGKGFNDIVEVMTRTGTGVGLSEAHDTSVSVVVPCSSPVELQTPLVKHADANEMDIVASKDGPVSGNKCNSIAENEYDSQGNIISKHFKSREQCSDGATSMLDKGEGCGNFSCESRNDFGQDAITWVLHSSNEEICDGETSDVPSGEVAPTVRKTGSSNDDCVEIPSSRQGELDGTILNKPVCGSSIEVEANGSNDGAKNMAPMNSQSSEEHIPSLNTMFTPNCENAAQIHELDDHYGSNHAETLNSPLSDERVSTWNSKSPQDHVCNENVMCMLNCENFAQVHPGDDGNGSDNVVILNSPLIDERNADGTIVLNRDAHVGMLETSNFTPSTEQISGGAVEKQNQPSLEKENLEIVSSSISAGQIPVEVSETSHERARVNVLDGEEAVGMPGTVNCTDYPEDVTPLSSSSMDQISNRAPVLDGDLSSGPCTTSSRNGQTLPDEQISSLVPENSHEEAECQLTDSVMVDVSTTSDQQEGVCRTMTENCLSQETPVSRSVDLMEPLEQVQPLSSVESPPDRDTAREMQNALESSPVDIVPANQSINDSQVMEPPEQEGQLPSAGFLSSNLELSNLPLVTGTEDQPSNEADLPNHIPETSIEIQNQAVVQHASNSDQQERVCRTITENSLSQVTPASRSVDLTEPLEQVQPVSSVESPPDRNTAREMQTTLVSSHVDIIPANQSINYSLVMEPPEQGGQLPSAGLLSSNQELSNLPLVAGNEDQLSNEDDLPNHMPETSIEIQNQDVVQRASNLELDSCSRQVVHPASNMGLDSLLPGGVRLQSSDTRNLSTTEINSYPIQPASQSASGIIPHLCHDPLKNELERLRRLREQNMKDHENKKLQLKYDFEKELEELCRKFDIKRKEIDAEFQKIRKNLDTQFDLVLVNKLLAEAFRAKSMDLKVSGASGMQQVQVSAD